MVLKRVPGPEKDILAQVKQGLKAVSAPVYYDGHPHPAKYPQVIVDFENVQIQPRLKSAEAIKATISVDVYTEPGDMGTLLDLGRQVEDVMQTVRCKYWVSDFDNYSGRILNDETEKGDSLKRDALLFDYLIYSFRKG